MIVDVATLTGHLQIALGDRVGAVLGTRRPVAGRSSTRARRPASSSGRCRSPRRCSERVTSCKVADLLQHDWVRWGGGLYASAFLREFTGGLPWAHLDIAGNEIQRRRPLRPRAVRRHRLRRHDPGRLRALAGRRGLTGRPTRACSPPAFLRRL